MAQSQRSTATSRTDPWHDPGLLSEMYLGREMTTREIADEMYCSNGTISRKLNDFGIPTRENWKAGVEAAAEANRVEYVQNRTLDTGYEYWGTRVDGVMRIVYVHRLLAVAEYGFDAVVDMDVHHGAGEEGSTTPWDNRPGNLGLMTQSEHGKMHSDEYWGSQ